MPTLSDVLRTYTPNTDSSMVEPIKNYINNLPEQTAQNIKQINWMAQNANPYDYTGGKNPYYSYDPQAEKEFNEYIPNLMNSTLPRKELIGNIFDKVMGVFGKGQKIPQMPQGVVFENLHPNVQTKVQQGLIDPADAQWISDYAYTPGNSQVETGTGAWKDQSEKMQNFVQRIKNGEVSMPSGWDLNL